MQRNVHHDQEELISGMQGFFISTNQSVCYPTLTNWRIKTMWSSQQMQRKLWTKPNTHFWLKKEEKKKKTPPERGHRGNQPQHNKDRIGQTHSWYHSQWWKAEKIPAEIRNKTRTSALSTIIQHSNIGSHSNQRRKRNERHPNWKGRSKTITVCRWHDSIPRKS